MIVAGAVALASGVSVAAYAADQDEAPVESVCELPPKQRSIASSNPTNNELQAALEGTVACMEGKGLVVSTSNLAFHDGGYVQTHLIYDSGPSGLGSNQASEVEDDCRDGLEALTVARGAAVDAKRVEQGE